MKALLGWWDDMGVALDVPVTRPRRALSPAKPRPERSSATASGAPSAPTEARRTATAAAARAAGFGEVRQTGPSAASLAEQATTLDALKAAIEGFDGCPLRSTARSTVFARGRRDAPVMVIGDAPGKEDDAEGIPFQGEAGRLLDRMMTAIGLGRDDFYATNLLNWRPPGNRAPTAEEIAQCLPFAQRHVSLKAPRIVVLLGGLAARSLLGQDHGIVRLRGKWLDYPTEAAAIAGNPPAALALHHPLHLLKRPADKKLAWQDLQLLQTRLRELETQ
ncbi:uracil-DNA glycosylase [Maricaulis sp. CAU 1757]